MWLCQRTGRCRMETLVIIYTIRFQENYLQSTYFIITNLICVGKFFFYRNERYEMPKLALLKSIDFIREAGSRVFIRRHNAISREYLPSHALHYDLSYNIMIWFDVRNYRLYSRWGLKQQLVSPCLVNVIDVILLLFMIYSP